MSGLMGRNMLSILVIIAGTLLSDHHAAAQTLFETTTTTSATSRNTPNVGGSLEFNVAQYCSVVLGISELDNILASGLTDANACAHSLQQYACADVGKASVNSIVSILKCYSTNLQAIITQEAFTLFISKISSDPLKQVVETLTAQAGDSITETSKKYLLNAVWENIRKDSAVLSPGFLATWFQERLYLFLHQIDSNILDSVASLPLTCEAFQAIVEALDVASHGFEQSVNELIGQWITKFLRQNTCKKSTAAEFILTYYRGFRNYVSYSSYSATASGLDLSSALSVLPAFQLAQYGLEGDGFSNPAKFAFIQKILDKNDILFTVAFLDSLSQLNLPQSTGRDVLFSLLDSTLVKLNSPSNSGLCKPSLKEIIQKIGFLLVAINEQALSHLPSNLDCSDLQIIVQAINGQYDNIPAENQRAVFKYILNYLNNELSVAGAACNYKLQSKNWLQFNFAGFSIYLNYTDMIRLNPSFNGYEAIELLTLEQIVDLIIESNILIETNQENAEVNIGYFITYLKTKNYTYLQNFLIRLRVILIKRNILIIKNERVRCLLLGGIWDILKSQFSSFSSDDWFDWFNAKLPIFSPCITKEQLSFLTPSLNGSCSNYQTVVQGLDLGFEHMTKETKVETASWIGDFLKTTKCDSKNWLADNYRRFSLVIKIRVIIEDNPDFNPIAPEVLSVLAPDQLGQVVLVSEQAQTNVTVIETIFANLVDVPKEEVVSTLGTFWDEVKTVSAETTNVKFTEEVKYTMLNITTSYLAESYSNFTEKNFSVWFEERLTVVINTINQPILEQIPLTTSCASFKNVVRGLDKKFEESNKNDVYKFLSNFQKNGKKSDDCTKVETTKDWVKSYYANFSKLSTYKEFTTYFTNFSLYEEGVLNILTPFQIGDAIAYSQTLESLDQSTQLFTYLETLDATEVDVIFRQFTETAIKESIVIKNVEVARFILFRYLRIITKRIQSYTEINIIELFERRIILFIKFFTNETLNLIAIRDCNSLTVAVSQLNKAYDQLSAETRGAIAKWILSILQKPAITGCSNVTQEQTQWIQIIWRRFFVFISYKEVKTVYNTFDILTVLNDSSVSQKAEFIASTNILSDVTTVKTVLESLKDETTTVSVTTIFSFLETFNAEFEKLTFQSITAEVKEEVVTFLISNLFINFKQITEVYIKKFYIYFRYFLSGITVKTVKQVPQELTCSQFSAIYSAFSKVYKVIADDVKQAVYDKIVAYLKYQYNIIAPSENVCSSLYNDTKTYIENVYFSFVYEATFTDLSIYYKEFNVYEVLEVFSATQLGNLLIDSPAIKEEKKAVQILVEVDKRTTQEVFEFIEEVNRVSVEQNIAVLPNPNVQDLIFSTVWEKLSTTLKTSEDYKDFYESKLNLLITSFSIEEINKIDTTINCSAQSSVVGAFSNSYDRLSEEQRSAVFSKIISYLQTTGSNCDSDKPTSEWISKNFAKFAQLATFELFQGLNANFSVESALSVCTGTQIGEYVVSSGALQSEEKISTVLTNLDTTVEVQQFLEKVNTVAPVQLKESPFVEKIVQTVFEVISDEFDTFSEQQWKNWTQVSLENVLFAVTEKEVEAIPSPLPCQSYQQVIKGFDNAFEDMTNETKQTIYKSLIKPQFNNLSSPSGVICGTKDERTQQWLDSNFGKFAVYVELTEITQWNKQFSPAEVVGTLSVDQLAEVVLVKENINNEELACQVVGKLKSGDSSLSYEFLDSFSKFFVQLNLTQLPNEAIRVKYLSEIIKIVTPELKTYSAENWKLLLSVRLKPFLSSITVEQLDVFLANVNCESYAVIVKSLDEIYDYLTVSARDSLFESLWKGLERLFGLTGSSCLVSGEGSKDWLARVFGKYAASAQYQEILTLYPDFNGLDVIEQLSPEQLAGLAVTDEILNDESQADTVILTLNKLSYDQIYSFLANFQANADKRNIVSLPNIQIRSKLLAVFLNTLRVRFNTFSAGQWRDILIYKLKLFLPSITVEHLSFIPKSIDCSIYPVIISALDIQYNYISEDVRKVIYQKAYTLLSGLKALTGSACTQNAAGSVGWLKASFGLYSYYATFSELTSLNDAFIATDAVLSLTAKQLAQFTINSDALSSSEKIAKIFTGVTSVNLDEYIDEFNLVAKEKNIVQLPDIRVRSFISGEIFCRLGSRFSSFTTADYTQWFQVRLKFFISSLNAKTLGFIPIQITCDQLAVLVQVFSDSTNNENPQDIYNFIQSVLKYQLTASGSACTSGISSDREWLLKNFGSFRSYAQWSDITYLYSTFQGLDSADLLSSTQLASASVTTFIISDAESISVVIDSLGDDIDNLFQFIGTVKEFALMDVSLLSNVKARDAILLKISELVFPKLGTLPLASVEKWFFQINFLLASINSTMLDYINLNIPCSSFQTVIKYLDQDYASYPLVKKNAVYSFQKRYLEKQNLDNGAPCLEGTSDACEWAQKNFAKFCRVSIVADIRVFYPDIDVVSYSSCCLLSVLP
ncbi:uncharacterized protein LOC128642092 [Bombina bombina]|uniref:uncharacterized protein LOC128642092 n=1 Tax=Bombina bombina TaxID=8345 RepID=UPI00235ADBD3|nr:uncharacterized protein LOC128642092 [Bombina bombina]